MAKLYRPGGPPSGTPSDPRPGPDGLRPDPEDDGVVFPYESLTHRLGGYEDGWVIVTSPAQPELELWLLPAEVTLLAGPAGGVPGPARAVFAAMAATRTEAGQKRSVNRVLYLLAGAAVFAWLLMGGCSSIVLRVVPASVEQELGQALADGMAEDAFVCEDPALVGAVEQILVRLVKAMEKPPYTFRVRVLRSDEVNAFALPGGEIFFHSALLEKAASEHEVAAVMGHEIQHVMQRHGLRSMLRSAGISAGLMILLGDASETVATLVGYASSLTNLKFGRDQERESDVKGVTLMARAGFDTDGAVGFFGRLAEEAGDDGGAAAQILAIASTHPASSERTERLRELSATTRPRRPQGLGLDWTAIRANCSAPGAPKPSEGSEDDAAPPPPGVQGG